MGKWNALIGVPFRVTSVRDGLHGYVTTSGLDGYSLEDGYVVDPISNLANFRKGRAVISVGDLKSNL